MVILTAHTDAALDSDGLVALLHQMQLIDGMTVEV